MKRRWWPWSETPVDICIQNDKVLQQGGYNEETGLKKKVFREEENTDVTALWASVPAKNGIHGLILAVAERKV